MLVLVLVLVFVLLLLLMLVLLEVNAILRVLHCVLSRMVFINNNDLRL